MDEAMMRKLAERLLGELAAVIPDPAGQATVRHELEHGLRQPDGGAARILRRALKHEAVRPWVSRQRQAEPDEHKLPVDEDEGMPVRFLTGTCPDEVLVGQRFPLEVAITRQPHDRSSALRPFAVPPEGLTLTLALRPGGLVVHTDHVMKVFVPPDNAGDSDTVLFELTAPRKDVFRPSVRAYVGGKPVGELGFEIVVGTRIGVAGRARSTPMNDLSEQPDELSLDIVQVGNGYEYRLLSGDIVESQGRRYLSGDLVAMLHDELTRLATTRTHKGRSARAHLEDLGLRLWNDAFPDRVKQRLSERLDRIESISVISDLHTVPWEVLYPAGQNGFLAERLPIVRHVRGHENPRTLDLSRAAYVHPPTSPDVAMELDAVRRILGDRVVHLPRISDLAELADLLVRGDFGVLHLACHNESRLRGWDRVPLADGPFTPVNLEKAKSGRTLTRSRPLVFFNACRTTGGAVDTRIDSWAASFLGAGCAAFVGSVWPVRTGAARSYAESFYTALVHQGKPLGAASLAAREEIKDSEDPTWLAYAVYGNAGAVAMGT